MVSKATDRLVLGLDCVKEVGDTSSSTWIPGHSTSFFIELIGPAVTAVGTVNIETNKYSIDI